jgi:hypothetical protein
MPLKHHLGRLGRDPNPIHNIQPQRHDSQSGRRAPEVPSVECHESGHRKGLEVLEQVWTEFNIEGEECGREERVGEKVDWESSGLEEPECVSWYCEGGSATV